MGYRTLDTALIYRSLGATTFGLAFSNRRRYLQLNGSVGCVEAMSPDDSRDWTLRNHQMAREAIVKSGIDREEFFLTSKVGFFPSSMALPEDCSR